MPRIGPGGITRGASVHEFPASIGIAGVSMRLEPGAMRELHWHANAAEWAYVITGTVRTTILHPDGKSYIDTFFPGDVWYFPKGYGHAIQNIGDKEAHFILIFDNGDFSEDHTFSITDFIAHVPAAIAAQNLGITLAEIEQLPKAEAYFANSAIPGIGSTIATPQAAPALTSLHRYPLEAQQPRVVTGGGTQKLVTAREFPISQTISGSILALQPGALRELHWHPNADEWQYFLSGQAEITVFLAEGQAVTEQYEAGDIGYAPMGAGHYIRNTGTEVCKILIGFNSGEYQSLDLSHWLASNPTDLLAGNFSIPATLAGKFPHQEAFIIPATAELY